MTMVEGINRLLASDEPEDREDGERRLTALLDHVTASVAWGRRIIDVGYFGYMVVLASVLLHHYFIAKPDLLPLVFPAMIGWYAAQWVGARIQKSAAKELAGLNDVRAIPQLMHSAMNSTVFRGSEFQAPLVTLLRRVRPSDAHLYDNHLRKHFRHIALNRTYWAWAGNYYDTEFVVAFLQALSQIGDDRVLDRVERLAKRAHDPRVRAAAEGCLEYLRMRAEEERPAQTLLRPATDGAPQATLLRPADDSAESDPQQLLRPAQLTSGDGTG